MMQWVLLTEREVREQEARAARERRAAARAPRCSCGRFVARGRRCSLEHPVYIDGTFAGYEHP